MVERVHEQVSESEVPTNVLCVRGMRVMPICCLRYHVDRASALAAACILSSCVKPAHVPAIRLT